MTSEAVQVGRTAVIHTVAKSCSSADKLSAIVGAGLMIVGSTMGLAGTKCIRHNVGVVLCARLNFGHSNQ